MKRKSATKSAYVAAHKKVARERGRADTFTCRCGQRAHDWAYQGGASVEYEVNGAKVFSMDVSTYEPMCRSCHFKMDGHGVGQKHGLETRRAIGKARSLSTSDKSREASSKNGKAVGDLMSARKRKCSCGKVSNPGAISIHQKYTGHTGFEDLK